MLRIRNSQVRLVLIKMIKRGIAAGPADWIRRGPLDNSPDHGSGLSNGCATFPQRPGRRKPVGSGGWNGLVTVGGKSIDPPTDYGW